MRQTLTLLLATLLLFSTASVGAERSTADAAEKAELKKRVLTRQERAEKAARRACKVKLCKALAGEVPPEGKISCDIVKTWREADIEDMLGGQISWPWSKAVCRSSLEVDRKALRDAMIRRAHKLTLPNQSVICDLERKGVEDRYEILVQLAPEVGFESGKATEARLNWSDVDAPLAIYPLIYSGTGLDNRINALGPDVVELVNQFTTKKCAEVDVKPRAAPTPKDDADRPAAPGEDESGTIERKLEGSDTRRSAIR